MNERAKVTMMLCSGLHPEEQEKVERLDAAIAKHLIANSLQARICRAVGDNSDRMLEFCGNTGVAATVPAGAFVAATDSDAISLITFANAQ